MEYFLERIAKLLYDENGKNLRNQCLVFPNRRAGLYFLKYLAAQIDKPVWAPATLTINDFFSTFSPLHVAENEILLIELYKIYRKLNKSPENFDEFYFWGDMLLNDFDDIDKYMADASVLFRNVQDFKNIDNQFGDLDEEQAEIIKRFWKNFEPEKPTKEKLEFKNIWSILSDLYIGFRSSLRSLNLAYEGMIFRDLAEKLEIENKADIRWEMVHFIGFNALNKCEETIMKQLKKEGLARFYWDYDNSYIKGGKLNSAGLFLNKNFKSFNNDMPGDWNYDTLLSAKNTDIGRRLIATTSDIAQVKLISNLVKEIPDLSSENAHHTAVVLADENLLVPVLTSLPEDIGDVNITMGYPLRQTNVYSLIKQLLNLQRNTTIENGALYFSFRDVNGILKHQLIEHLLDEEDKKILEEIVKNNLIRVPSDHLKKSAILVTIFRKADNPALLSDYIKDILTNVSVDMGNIGQGLPDFPMQKNIRNEFIYRVLLSINRLEMIVNNPDISFKTDTYIRILDKILRNQSVPFSGEPLSGIQIMGILETRALDFKNIIMLSVNEGILPGVSTGSSFIPFSIREAFGLPTINHQESIFAYHFYRLLHRAENITFVYNSNSDGLRTGEMSRFLLQMKYEQILGPELLNLSFDIKTPVSIREIIERNEKHSAQLYSLYLDKKSETILSPTAINTWLNCRMRFYYRYVNRLKESAKVSDDIDHAMFGKMLHGIMKNIYNNYSGGEITISILDSIIRDENKLLLLIDKTINENYNREMERSLSDNELIVRDILLMYLIKILRADKTVAPFTIINLEESFIFNLNAEINSKIFTIRTGGNIDRIDCFSGITRIVDYKTGVIAPRINSVSDLFTDDRKKDYDGWLQTLLYCEAYLAKSPDALVKPSVYRVKELPGHKYADTLKIRGEKNSDLLVENYEIIRKEYLYGLTGTIKSIFSSEEPFRMTHDENKCRLCPYKALCMR